MVVHFLEWVSVLHIDDKISEVDTVRQDHLTKTNIIKKEQYKEEIIQKAIEQVENQSNDSQSSGEEPEEVKTTI